MNVLNRDQLVADYLSSANAILLLFVVVLVGVIIGNSLPNVPRLIKRGLRLHWLIAGGVLIRFVLMFDSFWYDEAFTGTLARVGLSDLHKVVISDVHPPTWYALSHIVGRIFGYSDFALRLPAFGFGLISIGLAYMVARAITNQRTAMITVIILLYLPNHIFYSTEARQYTLLACVVLLGIWAVHRRMSLIPVIALLPYLHSYGFLYLAGIAVYAVIMHPRKVALVALSVAGGSLYLPIMLMQSSDVSNGFWLPDFAPGASLTYITEMIGQRVTPDTAFLPLAVGLGLTIWGLWRWQWRAWGLPMIAIGVPLVASVLSIVWHNIYLVRALLPCQMLIVIIWAHGLAKTKSFTPTLSLVGATAMAMLALLTGDVHKPDWRVFLTHCDDLPVYATSTSTAIIVMHYTGRVMVWSQGDDLNQWLSDDAKTTLGMVIKPQPPQPSCIIQMTNGNSDRSQNAMLADMDLRLVYDEQKRISKVTVYVYE